MILCIVNLDHTHWTLLVSISDQTYTTLTDNQILLYGVQVVDFQGKRAEYYDSFLADHPRVWQLVRYVYSSYD